MGTSASPWPFGPHDAANRGSLSHVARPDSSGDARLARRRLASAPACSPSPIVAFRLVADLAAAGSDRAPWPARERKTPCPSQLHPIRIRSLLSPGRSHPLTEPSRRCHSHLLTEPSRPCHSHPLTTPSRPCQRRS